MSTKSRFSEVVGALILMLVILVSSACASATPTKGVETAAPPANTQSTQPTQAVQSTEASQPTQASASTQASTFDWKKFSGQTIKVYIADSGEAQYIKPKLPEFEALTGMKVDFETADATSYRNNLPVQLTAQSSDFDVMATFPSVDALQFSANGWYEPLDKYIEDPTLTNPDFDFADFPDGARASMKSGKDTIAILWEMQTDLIYYRKDLLQQAGLAVPDTFEGWLEAAQKINDPAKELYGVALRGAGYQITTPYSAFLYGDCGTWTKDGKATINTPEALSAFEMYGKWGQLGPPGIVNFDWQVPAQQFAQGKIFLFLDINLFVNTLEDPAQSTVAGKVGYALVPKGPCSRSPFIGGWGYTINPFSQKKDQAWYFIQWAASKQMNLQMKLAGWPSPRASAWNSPEFKAQDKTPEFTSVVLESLKLANAEMNPPVAPGKEARDIVGVVGTHALEGATPEQLKQYADEQNAALQQLLDAMQ